jgi:CheY-like chemotaxis protein
MIDKLLLIDDDEIASYLIGKLVKKSQLVNDFVVQENGKDGIDFLRSITKKEDFPDVIFVDLDMPVLNGYGFLSHYQEEFWRKHPGTQVVMLTSSQRKLDWNKAMQFDCLVDFIFKPVTKDYLEQLTEGSTVG